MLKIYPIEEEATINKDISLYKNIQAMIKEECVIRIYIVKGIELQPKDSNGKVNIHKYNIIYWDNKM